MPAVKNRRERVAHSLAGPVEMPPRKPPGLPARLGSWLAAGTRRVILGLDRLLRTVYGIREFSADPECILRIARERSPQTVRLADGTLVVKGAPGIGLHFWNEHIPPIDPAGPDLAWGLKFYRRLRKSLQALAEYIDANNDLNDAVALWAEVSFPAEPGLGRYDRLLEALGFEFKPLPPPAGLPGRVGRFFQHLYAWALIWTFNPPSLRRKNLLAAERGRLWISKAELLRRHLRR